MLEDWKCLWSGDTKGCPGESWSRGQDCEHDFGQVERDYSGQGFELLFQNVNKNPANVTRSPAQITSSAAVTFVASLTCGKRRVFVGDFFYNV